MIRLGFWNIGGLRNKFVESDFAKFINLFDIFNFSETWLKNNENLTFHDSFYIFKICQRKANISRYPGGVLSRGVLGGGTRGYAVPPGTKTPERRTPKKILKGTPGR